MALIPWRNKGTNEMRDGDFLPSVTQFRQEMDRLFDRFLRSPFSAFDLDAPGWFSTSWVPSADVNETENEITINLELPGVDPKNLDISLSGNSLTVEGEKKEETEDKGKNYYRSERRFGSFRRIIELPQPVKEDSVTADYKNGLLTLKARKLEGTGKKKIPIVVSK